MKNKLIPFLTLVLIISCGGGGGGGGSDALVVPTVSISADNPKRYLGYSVNGNISWSISNVDSCTGSDGLSGVTISGGSGGASYGFMATETGSFTFTITCTASGGGRSASVTIDVYEYKEIEMLYQIKLGMRWVQEYLLNSILRTVYLLLIIVASIIMTLMYQSLKIAIRI